MNIERGERVEQKSGELWRIDVFDTPGLNDGDNLDVWYQAAIEDHIQIMQQASTLVMTVSIGEGIKGNVHNTLDSYRELFGESMASMLILILTESESADEEELEELKEDNRSRWIQFDSRLQERNVYCVSLRDLRESGDSASHKVLEGIVDRCKGMPLQLIQSLVEKRNELKEAISDARKGLEVQVEELVNNGWQTYEHLAGVYASSSKYTKLTMSSDGWFDGMVMKKTSMARRLLAYGTIGIVNRIQKTAIQVQCLGKMASEVWGEFLQEKNSSRYNQSLMAELGDRIYNKGLAVVVQDLGFHRILTLNVHRYSVTIFHPTSYVKVELIDLLQAVVDGEARDLRQEVIDELMEKAISAPVRIPRGLSRFSSRR
ncbi:P-loop containing nucleoside triphosphate hydrolase [Gracilaria domingensis]|nr:P-loop containing nucleoside triphosphate hydrolase [Gracilaria domingensis]